MDSPRLLLRANRLSSRVARNPNVTAALSHTGEGPARINEALFSAQRWQTEINTSGYGQDDM
jgi:hypothetical protein